MKVSIEVADKEEGEAIQRAMKDKKIRTLIALYGSLLAVTPRSRRRILQVLEREAQQSDE